MISRATCGLLVVAGFGLGLLCSSGRLTQVVQSQESKPAVPDQKPFEASAKQFEAAFNKGDAAAIAAQFHDDAEVIDDDGTIISGRADIQARFEELFKTNPKAKTVVELHSLRHLGNDVAVEDGVSTTTLDPDQPASRSPYTLIHVKKSGQWRIARIRDFPEEVEETAHDQLQGLSWLVGEWVDQSGDTKVETTCRWDDGGNYLVQDYVIKTREGKPLKGSQRIGWDAQRKTVRGWAFDQAGGFAESIWTPIDDGWVIKAEGYTADGHQASATRTVTILGTDLYQIDSTQRLVGEELLEDTSVRVARRPPTPAAQ